MSRYVLVLTGGGMPESEEEQAQVMAAWGAWYQELGAAVADPGNPLGPPTSIVEDRSVSDGAVSSPPASGFTILHADSMEAAVEMAKGCPILDGNGQVTVYEAFEM